MVEHFSKEYASPAYMKLLNAGRHFRSLEVDILDWTASNRLLAPTKASATDASTIEFFRPAAPVVPELAWSCRFGDGVHNLRSALDLLAFELCHIDGGTPSNPDKVYFPVVEKESGWENRTRHLGSIPASLLERIRAVQPWHSRSPKTHFLALLNRLDNMDKHRTSIGMTIMPGGLEPPRLQALPVDDNVGTLWQQPWLKLGLSKPLHPAALPALWHVDPAPMIYFEGRMAFLRHLQPWLFQQTKRVFGSIATGEWPTIENPVPEPVWAEIPA